MRFTDFKIVIDGKLEGDEDAESIESIFGKVEKKEDTATDNDDTQPPMMSPQQQEIELDKAEHGKSSDAIDSIVDDDEIDDEEEADPKDNLTKLGL